MEYLHFDQLADEIEIPKKGITSYSLISEPHVRVVVFGFADGEEMTEHTAAVPAIAHVLSGEFKFTVPDKTFNFKAGSWIHMDAHLPHSLVAKGDSKLVLYLCRGLKSAGKSNARYK